MDRKLPDDRLLADCRVEAMRGSGPGGQKRNKTSSFIRLTHNPTGLSVVAGESRSQNRNRQNALSRLRHKMALTLRNDVELSDFPQPQILRISARSADYPAAIGRILDVLDHAGWSISETARIVGVSTGQLISFLRSDPLLWAEVNRRRQAVGLRGLN
jgi:hypothetical protein